MNIDNASPRDGTDDAYAWFSQGSLPRSTEDRIAEAVALVALLFSLGIGLVIATLPVSAKGTEPLNAPAYKSRAGLPLHGNGSVTAR